LTEQDAPDSLEGFQACASSISDDMLEAGVRSLIGSGLVEWDISHREASGVVRDIYLAMRRLEAEKLGGHP